MHSCRALELSQNLSPSLERIKSRFLTIIVELVPSLTIREAYVAKRATWEVKISSHTKRESKLLQNLRVVRTAALGKCGVDMRSITEASPNYEGACRSSIGL